jgi:arylsulfatase A
MIQVKIAAGILFTLVSAMVASQVMADDEVSPLRPNIIFILADDLGIGNVGCYGADHYKTPCLDLLAAGGVRFTHMYTAPLCGPSRAMIMTGRYPFRTGATNQDSTGRMLPKSETFLSSCLQSAGYRTASIGKWGQLPLTPLEFGFDEEFRVRGSGVYRNTEDRQHKYWVNGEERQLQNSEYMPDLMHSFLADFISRHRDRPFFVYYSLSNVHGELLPTPDSGLRPDNLMVDNLSYMDKLIGRLTAELERLQLSRRTLVVFMGDNGTGSKWADEATIEGQRLSGKKGDLLEGGSLVPCIASWPGVSPGGRVCPDLLDASDLLPTFVELAGARLPTERPVDGRSFAPQLRGLSGNPRTTIFMQLASSWYVRSADWKLNHRGELFDMRRSPFEERLVAESSETPASRSARAQLTAELAGLNPAAGIPDDGDGTGRHAGKSSNGNE